MKTYSGLCEFFLKILGFLLKRRMPDIEEEMDNQDMYGPDTTDIRDIFGSIRANVQALLDKAKMGKLDDTQIVKAIKYLNQIFALYNAFCRDDQNLMLPSIRVQKGVKSC